MTVVMIIDGFEECLPRVSFKFTLQCCVFKLDLRAITLSSVDSHKTTRA